MKASLDFGKRLTSLVFSMAAAYQRVFFELDQASPIDSGGFFD